MIAHCIFMDNGIEEVVLVDKDLAKERLEELAMSYWDSNKSTLINNFNIRNYKEYRNSYCWHIHEAEVFNKKG